MSIIIDSNKFALCSKFNLESNKAYVYCKGASEIVLDKCSYYIDEQGN